MSVRPTRARLSVHPTPLPAYYLPALTLRSAAPLPRTMLRAGRAPHRAGGSAAPHGAAHPAAARRHQR